MKDCQAAQAWPTTAKANYKYTEKNKLYCIQQ